MARHTEFRAHVAWWLAPYLHCLAAACALMRREPNPEKLRRVIDRAITVRAK